MKKIIFPFTICAFMMASLLMSCNSPEEKVEKAEENIEKAKLELEQAKKDLEQHQADMEAFRKVTAERIAANKQRIADLRAGLDKANKATKVTLEKQITEFEQRNNDLEKKMDEFKDETKEGWERFKVELNHDMDDLGEALRNLSVDNVK